MKYKLLFLALLSVGLTACVERAGVRYDADPHPQYSKNGPPPHAPAHGYRSKYHQHDMIYDSKIGAYIVVGWAEHYFDNDVYFRFRDGHWEINVNLDNDRGWKHVDDREVPYKLRSSKVKKSKYKDNKREKYDNDRGKSNNKNKHDRDHDRDYDDDYGRDYR